MDVRNRTQIIERLKNIPFLKFFQKDYLGDILNQSKLLEYRPGDRIITEGTRDKVMYILLSGEVKIVKKDEEIAHLNYIGDIFGELAIINNEPRSDSVFALQPTTCLTINTEKFEKLPNEERAAIFSIIFRICTEVLADRLKASNEEIVELHREIDQYQESLKRLKKLTGG